VCFSFIHSDSLHLLGNGTGIALVPWLVDAEQAGKISAPLIGGRTLPAYYDAAEPAVEHYE